MANWYIEHAGQLKTLADWGVAEGVLSYRSQDADVLQFRYVGRWEAANRLFPYGEKVKLFKDGVQWFVGTVVKRPIAASDKSEEALFVVKGPWLYLEEHEIQVAWTSWDPDAQEVYNSHVIYNVDGNGALVSTSATIGLIIDYLLSLYAADKKPLQKGTILNGVNLFVPSHEDRNLSCAQALRQQLAWHRDAVTWFDYTTDPPTMHVERRSSLGEVTLALPPAASGVSRFEIEARDDLVRPSVVIQYEQRNMVNSTPRFAISIDAYPPGATGREFGAWTMSVDLLGSNKTTVSGTLRCRNKDWFNPSWWQNHCPKLSSLNVANLTISEVKCLVPNQILTGTAPLVEVADKDAYPNELVEGAIAPWMEVEAGGPVTWRHETFTAKASFQYFSQANVAGQPNIQLGEYDAMEVAVSLIATNAPTADSYYETTDSFEEGDPQPIGLAQYLYEQVKDLQYSGRFVLSEDEVSGRVRIGKLLNLMGGLEEWTAMRGMVQSVTEHLERGRTEIEFGPPEHLGVQDIIELLKVGRRRRRWSNPATQEGEEVSAIGLGEATAKADSGLGPARQSYVAFTPDTVPDPTTGRTSHVALDARAGEIRVGRKAQPSRLYLSAGTDDGTQKPQLLLAADADGDTINKGMVSINLNDIPQAVPAGDARVMKVREVCVKIGTEEKKMLVLGGGAY